MLKAEWLTRTRSIPLQQIPFLSICKQPYYLIDKIKGSSLTSSSQFQNDVNSHSFYVSPQIAVCCLHGFVDSIIILSQQQFFSLAHTQTHTRMYAHSCISTHTHAYIHIYIHICFNIANPLCNMIIIIFVETESKTLRIRNFRRVTINSVT